MPKVGQHEFTYHQTQTNLTTEVHFGKMRNHDEYNLRNKQVFFIKLPDDAAKFIGKKYVYADIFGDVTKQWEDVMSDYMNAKRTIKKVIAIDIKSHLDETIAEKLGVATGERYGNHSDHTPSRTNGNIVTDIKLEVGYSIGFIVTIGEKRFWSWEDDSKDAQLEDIDDSHYAYRDWKNKTFIDWTKEREAYVSNLYQQFSKLIAALRKFAKDEKSIVDTMDKQIKLLN